MDDNNNNNDSEDNLFGDSLGLFEDFPGLPKSDETPDTKKERPAPDKPPKTPAQKKPPAQKQPPQKPAKQKPPQNTSGDGPDLFDDLKVPAKSAKAPGSKDGRTAKDKPSETPVQKKPPVQKQPPQKPAKQKSSQNTSGDGPDLFDDLKVPGEADKAPVTKKSPAAKVKPSKPPAQKQQPPKKPLDKKTAPPEQSKQSKTPVKKDTPVAEKKTPVKETAKKAPQKVSPKVPQKKQEVKPEKKPPIKEPAPAADTSSKEVPEKVKKPVKQEKEKIIPDDKPKKRVNPVIFTLSIFVLVVLSMFIGSIIDFDSILNLIKKEDPSTSVREPVPAVNTNTKEATPPKETVAPPPSEDIVETKVEQKIEQKVEPKDEPPEIIFPDTPKEKEEIQFKTEPLPPENPDKISGVFKKRILSFPYSVYFGSYNGIANVKKASSDIEDKGISCYWIKLDLGEKGIWYRLFTGYFQTRKEADEYIKTMKLQGAESKITKHANLVGTYTSIEDTEKHKAILEEKGYSPYIINDAENTYQLYTGAFYQKDRAQEQNSDLASDGIESELVER